LNGFKISSHYYESKNEEWRPVFGERNRVLNRYNELAVVLSEQSAQYRELRIVFRAYNEGVAFRYELPERPNAAEELIIVGERSQFHFPDGCLAYEHHGAEGEYHLVPVSELQRNCERPLTVVFPNGAYASLTEAAMNDYARMLLEAENGIVVSRLSGLVTEYVGYDNMDTDLEGRWADGIVRTVLPFASPWRVLIVGDKPGDLLERNDIILNLSEPCKIENTNWIVPGKLLREMTLTYDGAIACVDFAAEFEFKYMMFDWGWYGDPFDDHSLCTNQVNDVWYFKMEEGVVYPQLDMSGIVEYAASKGIGVILYLDRRAVEQQLEQFLPIYKEWGIKGIKIGFVNCGPQLWTKWLHDVVRKCAEYELLVNVHDAYRPTGFSRTYPNLLTQEGIRGNEHMPTSRHNCTLPFTRFVAGAGDYTICYYTDRKQTTHAHQLAMSVIAYSPMQSVFWYDKPSHYEGEPEVEYFKHLPTVWDDSKVLDGSIGEYATIARRRGDDWFVGSITNELARERDIKLDFLEEGRIYIAYIYSDMLDAKITRTNVAITERGVDRATELRMLIAPNGGQAMRIVPKR
jgi:alpha-glucosidase